MKILEKCKEAFQKIFNIHSDIGNTDFKYIDTLKEKTKPLNDLPHLTYDYLLLKMEKDSEAIINSAMKDKFDQSNTVKWSAFTYAGKPGGTSRSMFYYVFMLYGFQKEDIPSLLTFKLFIDSLSGLDRIVDSVNNETVTNTNYVHVHEPVIATDVTDEQTVMIPTASYSAGV